MRPEGFHPLRIVSCMCSRSQAKHTEFQFVRDDVKRDIYHFEIL